MRSAMSGQAWASQTRGFIGCCHSELVLGLLCENLPEEGIDTPDLVGRKS